MIATSLHARPGSVLVAVRDAKNLEHLRSVLAEDESAAQRHCGDDGASHVDRAGEYDLTDDQVFRTDEKELFTAVVDDGREGRQDGGVAGGARQ